MWCKIGVFECSHGEKGLCSYVMAVTLSSFWDYLFLQDNFVFLSYRNVNRNREELMKKSVNLECLHTISSYYCYYYTYLSYLRKCPLHCFFAVICACWVTVSFHEQTNKRWSARASTLSWCFSFFWIVFLRNGLRWSRKGWSWAE